MGGYFYIPYEYLLEKRLINYLDGLWAITDIVQRTNHKPTVRRLVVPGHEHDERRKRDLMRRNNVNPFASGMAYPNFQQMSHRRRSMPTMPSMSTLSQFWYY